MGKIEKARSRIADKMLMELNKIAMDLPEEDIALNGCCLRPNRAILEHAIKREALRNSANNTDDAFKFVFEVSGEYPDGTKWERAATAEEVDAYAG